MKHDHDDFSYDCCIFIIYLALGLVLLGAYTNLHVALVTLAFEFVVNDDSLPQGHFGIQVTTVYVHQVSLTNLEGNDEQLGVLVANSLGMGQTWAHIFIDSHANHYTMETK